MIDLSSLSSGKLKGPTFPQPANKSIISTYKYNIFHYKYFFIAYWIDFFTLCGEVPP